MLATSLSSLWRLLAGLRPRGPCSSLLASLCCCWCFLCLRLAVIDLGISFPRPPLESILYFRPSRRLRKPAGSPEMGREASLVNRSNFWIVPRFGRRGRDARYDSAKHTPTGVGWTVLFPVLSVCGRSKDAPAPLDWCTGRNRNRGRRSVIPAGRR